MEKLFYDKRLFFSFGNAKIDKNIAIFSLPAGHTCRFARDCLSQADKNTGKIIDGKNCRFRCYAASEEAMYPNARNSRWYNYDLLKEKKTIQELSDIIQNSLPFKRGILRIHSSGDFFSENYFLAWLNVALNNKSIIFYGYTKCSPFLVKYIKQIPTNFRFTVSKGGTRDDLINKHKLKFVDTVFSIKEAREKGLVLDHDDFLAIKGKKPFALLIHGTQPKNSDAGKAMSILRKQGWTGYSRNRIIPKTAVTVKVHKI